MKKTNANSVSNPKSSSLGERIAEKINHEMLNLIDKDCPVLRRIAAIINQEVGKEPNDHSDFLAFMADELSKFPCCCENVKHSDTPPMMWPELVACIVKKAVLDDRATQCATPTSQSTVVDAETGLAPCPFCGEIPHVSPENPELDGNCVGSVECRNSKCQAGPQVCHDIKINDDRGYDKYKQRAIELWNRRAPLTAQPKQEVL